MGSSSSHSSFAEWAAKEGRPDDLEYHMRHGGPNIFRPRDMVSKTTLLHLAVAGGHTECVSILLKFGMSANIRDADRKSPLHLAVYNRKCGCVEQLLDNGAVVDAVTRFQSTPLHFASSVGSIRCAQLLLEYGADINAVESWGQSSLMIAVKQGHLEFVEYLLTQGPDLELVDHLDQQTALHVASCGRDVEIVRYLLDAGCVISALDKKGCTPLHLAIRQKFKEAVFLLLNRGACCDYVQSLRDEMPHRLPLIQLVEETQGGPLSLRQQCMIMIRGTFTPTAVEELPLPDMMKREIRRIPQVHCEYQRVYQDTYSKLHAISSLNQDADPLSRSSALITEIGDIEFDNKAHFTHVESSKESSSNCTRNNSLTEATDEDDAWIEVTAEMLTQFLPFTQSSVSNKAKKKDK